MSEFCFSFSFNYCYYWSWVVGIANINFVLTMQRKVLHSTGFPIVGGNPLPPPPHLPSKLMPPMGHTHPPFKNVAPLSEKETPH